MPGSRGQSAYINQTELICFTAFSGVLAPAYMSFRLASSGHGGPPSRAGARGALAIPPTEEYEGDKEWGVNVSPQPPPKCPTTQLIYAAEMNSFTVGIHKYLKGFKMIVSPLAERCCALCFHSLLSSLFWPPHFLISGC